uniref:Beta_elim_lyase domain-containing protein n=1 Tax=Heterorhabditis bacteriophora TaxID=37862 RepID=A0A1I7WN43_HETBA
MKQAMIDAQLGDDVYGEDTTVNELEKRCAELFGKEAGLFVASGTMGNLLAVMAHCQRGDEIIVGRQNHIHRWEQGNYAQLAMKEDGIMDVKDIEDSIRINDSHMPRTRLICLENTHNYAGGKALPISYLKSIRDLANRYNLLIHMDGARIYNAAIALGVKAVGGGWRQAGILAAAAHVALDKADVTIRKDHHNAQILAAGINQRTPESFKKVR